MAGGKYTLTPTDVPPVDTQYRRIQTQLPVPESLALLTSLGEHEPPSMQGQPPIVWERAEGWQVCDPYGNMWLDWSSGVLITSAGHGHPRMVEAICATAQQPLLATYCFAHAGRGKLAAMLVDRAPAGLDKVFLLSTGSEATENSIKLAKTWGRQQAPDKQVIVSFKNAFHGRTMGAQLAGGNDGQKTWIGALDPTFVQVPFPDGFKVEDTSFDLFERSLADAGIAPAQVAGVISETYQGVGPDFMPVAYAQALRRWCDDCGALLIFDEVQAGFGRTGKFWGFEHYDVTPDLIACGKGISGALPLSAVLGRSDVMSTYPPGSMTSTHSASPLAVACAIANLEIIDDEGLVAKAAANGERLAAGLRAIGERHAGPVGCVRAQGMVAGLQIVAPGSKEPDPVTAQRINEECFRRGLLMFAPVGIAGECIKISPPMSTPAEAIDDGVAVLSEVCDMLFG
jgi:4-aminobutyrate aminotransferase-like enzyme